MSPLFALSTVKGNPFSAIRYEESDYDIFRIEQTLKPGVDVNALLSAPADIFENSNVDLDAFMRQNMSGDL